jgi:hypothetical protein
MMKTPAVKTSMLSHSNPKAPSSKAVVVEVSLPQDRLKGYLGNRKLKDLSADERASDTFTGADARAALVGQYSKKNRKRFYSKPEKGESMKHERGESRKNETSEDDDY